jgi:hypothetical protein
MKTEKKFNIDIEGSEFKYLPTKHIELVSRDERGEYVISKFENLVQVQARRMKKRNIDKEILFEKYNTFKEKVQFCHYKGNDFINLFIDGGVHFIKFPLTLKDIDSLIKVLSEIRIRISCNDRTASQVHIQESKGESK